jgi:predicted ATPase
MKIVQLDIEGFRSLKNVSWRPGDLNVVIGPNGSGKSNLLRMLELISAAAQGKLADFVDASGGFVQLLWDGQTDWIEFTLKSFDNTGYGLSEASYGVGIRLLPDTNNSYRIDYESMQDMTDGFGVIVRGKSEATIFGRGDSQEVNISVINPEETLLSAMAFPLFHWINNSGLPAYQAQNSTWAIYQDIRTDQSASIRQSPVSRLEQRVVPDGQNLINVLHTLYTSDRQFKQDINDAMLAAFREDFDELIFPPAADQRIQMRVRWKTLKREQSTADLSDGTLRFLFLITILASPNPPPLIAVDEPETGLHPSMLPIIAAFAVEASARTQVIFTTHSDQFLDAFRETKPTTTVAKWVNGETVLNTIEGEKLDYWLQEYSLGSLFRSGELEEMAGRKWYGD